MSDERVPRVYAQALLEAALEADAVTRVGRELGDFVAALAASEQLRTVLADPQIDTDAKARVVVGLTRGAHPLVANALQLLLERGRFAIVEELRARYDELAALQAAILHVEVTSAVRLSSEVSEKIVARVQEATQRRVELAQRVDPGIIGGLVLHMGDIIVDASVRSRIGQLRRRLATAELER